MMADIVQKYASDIQVDIVQVEPAVRTQATESTIQQRQIPVVMFCQNFDDSLPETQLLLQKQFSPLDSKEKTVKHSPKTK